MLQATKKYYTPEEYLALEEVAEYKSEYFRGEIFAMAGGSVNHTRIAVNIAGSLNAAFEGRPCEAFTSDLQVQVKKNGLYTYPDVSVVCGEPEFADNKNIQLTNPQVIVEVLSPSTANYDRTKKFELYRSLESFEDYVLIDSERVYIEHHHKIAPGKWLMQTYENITETLKIPTIDFEMPLEKIYSRVRFETESDTSESNQLEEKK